MRNIIGIIIFITSCWIYSMLIPTLGWGPTVLLFVGMNVLAGVHAYLTFIEVIRATSSLPREITDEEWKALEERFPANKEE